MIKQGFFSFIVFSGITMALGQTPPIQTPQTYPAQTPQTYPAPGAAGYNQQGMGGLTFSNRMGQTFSPNDLASQLQNLRGVVDQTLPLLSAFNENYSNSVTGGRQTVGGALSGIVSDVLKRNQQTGQTSGGSQSAFGATNLLSMLHGLLGTNTTGAVGAAPSNAEDLKALQADLQLVASVLQRLNVSPASGQLPYNNGGVPIPNPNLTPTGR